MPTITTQRPATMQEMQDEIDRLRAGHAALYDREALLRALLVWSLYHHQGGSSEVGQPIRKALGMGPHDHISAELIAEAKRAVAAIRTVQELLGHKDVKTTQIYTHVLNRGGRAVISPLEKIAA